MPVTITSTEMVARIRGGSGAATATEVAELLGYATAQIERYLGDAYATTPDAVLNESARRIVGTLFDRPAASRYTSYSAVLRNSGAGEALLPYRIHRAGSTEEAIEAAQVAVGTVGNPVADVSVAGTELVVTFADGTEQRHALPAGRGGGGGGVLAVDNGALPAAAVTMRVAWAQPGDVIDAALFGVESNVGTTDRTIIPYFPAAYSDAGLDTGNIIFWAATDLIPAELPLAFEVVSDVRTALEIQGESGWYWSTVAPLHLGYGGFVGQYEGLATAFVLPGLLIATQEWVAAQIANIVLSGGGINEAQAQALVALHAALPNVHHIPAAGGGGAFPATRTQVFTGQASGTSASIAATEAWIPGQTYELLIGSRTRHIFLTTEGSGSYQIIYNTPDIAGDNTFESVYLFMVLTLGTTDTTIHLQLEGPGASVAITVNKLT